MCFVHFCGQLAAVPATAGDEISLCGSIKREREQAQRREVGSLQVGCHPILGISRLYFPPQTRFLEKRARQQKQQGNNFFVQFYLRANPPWPLTVLMLFWPTAALPPLQPPPSTLTLWQRWPRHPTLSWGAHPAAGVHHHTPQQGYTARTTALATATPGKQSC